MTNEQFVAEARSELVVVANEKDEQIPGKLGWVTLATLGVSFVIAGDYAGWNYGLTNSGWGGMIVAVALAAIMYLGLVFCLAELASALPAEGGGMSFVGHVLGRGAAGVTGICIAMEYILAAGGIGIFLGAYIHALTGLSGPMITMGLYIVFLSVNLLGANESMRFMTIMAAGAVGGLVVFLVVAVLHSDFSAKSFTEGGTAGGLFPSGLGSVWAAIPFAMAFFLAVEGVPLASGDAKDPARDVPRALIISWSVLTTLALAIIIAAPASSGLTRILHTDSPLVAAIYDVTGVLGAFARIFVNCMAVAAISVSFFSVIYAYSRQVYALAREGYLPNLLSRTNRQGAPVIAIVIPGIIAFGLALMGNAAGIIAMLMFVAALSYILMLVAYVGLRLRDPIRLRPYRTPGGLFTAITTLVMACIACSASIFVAPLWCVVGLGCLVGMFAMFKVTNRRASKIRLPSAETIPK